MTAGKSENRRQSWVTFSMQAKPLPVEDGYEQVQLTASLFVPTHGSGIRPKSPSLAPSVYINGHTLYVDDRLANYTMELYQGDDVAYQHYILNGESNILLPFSLSGEYVICFVNDEGHAYVGRISLL